MKFMSPNIMGKKNDKTPKGSAPNLNSLVDSYSCTGNIFDDFPELWKRNCSPDIVQPIIKARKRPPSDSDDSKPTWNEDEEEDVTPPQTYHIAENRNYFQPSIQCEFEGDETKQTKRTNIREIHIKGWEVKEAVISVLRQCLFDKLTTVNLWNAGLTDYTFRKFTEFLSSLPVINSVVIEGNSIPGSEPFAELLSKDIQIHNLSLRNNQITDIGAEKIGKALGSPDQPPHQLLHLNLAFNQISDNGATAIAKGLRMNRSLVSLSLASNQISNFGAKSLSSSLDLFALSHEEVVERRKLLSKRLVFPREESGQSSRKGTRKPGGRGGLQVEKGRQRLASPKRKEKVKTEEKAGKKQEKGKKEPLKGSPRAPSSDPGKQKNVKTGPKSRFRIGSESISDFSDQSHPLLSSGIEHKEGKIWMPGCSTLISLNLSRNQIGLEGMKYLLQVIKNQASESSNSPGLLKLSLQKNSVPHNNDIYLEIFQLMRAKDPLTRDNID